ncbi:PREDICTED: FACT complex subunit SSRP1-like [Amphimedon queenslandica]|uniref:FACT complex subunit SSRP1 n=3 Tax=Amphimedon queenslandica TaxID=400682 RepID=A0AAN0J2F5_AMPQE|nr:PREDICTED: FACT complex subunit SSRP1-like [Amphimedon queenslandica]|eukprot:XP_019850912.1 PREDICTED: FACT complex subunit SSRP1-like [Amphimedon queenslandica]
MDFKEIGHISRGTLELGKMRIQSDGLIFKSSEKTLNVKHSEIDLAEWLRVARGYELKVLSREGHVFKFSGFKESDYGDLRDFFKQNFGKDLKQVELCVKGWNWGEPVFKGSLLTFLVDSKPAFEVPLEEVSRVTAGKNEVSLEFHQNDTAAVSLMEMRFHVPTTGTDGEEDPVQSFHDKVQAKADILQATGNAIASFTEMHCLTPRGRYTIKVYPTFLGAHGKTFDYKIPFSSITRLFMLPHNDGRHLFLVLGLDPPIRQGQTRYPFFILQLENDETCELTLAMSEEDLKEKYGGKLTQEMEGPLMEVFARLMKVLVGKKLMVPGSFKNNNGQNAVACSCKATAGFLYPLEKGFMFVHKPALFIKFEDIANVNFARMASGGVSRSFDFDIETREGVVHHFSSLMRDDYTRLHEFVTEKRLKIKDKGSVRINIYQNKCTCVYGYS